METVKIALLGSAQVGKTSVLHRYIANEYRADLPPTHSASAQHLQASVGGRPYQFQFWEVSGQPRFRDAAARYVRRARACGLCFDRASRPSFEALPGWLALLRPAVAVVVFANKSDLDGGVATHEIDAFCRAHGRIPFFETSALSGQHVDDAFTAVLAAAVRERPEPEADPDGRPEVRMLLVLAAFLGRRGEVGRTIFGDKGVRVNFASEFTSVERGAEDMDEGPVLQAQ
jgi:small GTP-binding protein